MFEFQGIWLPDGEQHFPKWMSANGELIDGRGTYQIKKWRACLPWINDWRVAVDVGAHVGFWALQMARRFEVVHAFEPVQAMRECFNENVERQGRVLLYANALGAKDGWARMAYDPADSGGTHVERGAAATDEDPMIVPVRPLDAFGFHGVGFLKIDVEGYEAAVIEGARETLARCRPCVIVEQKPHKLAANYGTMGTPAVDLLRAMGAILRREIGGDYILSWP